MEAVPRLPMLSFELKHSPEYVEFGPILKQYIRDHYGEDPALYNKACTDLEQLRQSAVHVTRDFMGCSTLKKYFSQLQLLQGRFPMHDGGEAAIAFTWEDITTGREHVMADMKFEQACILYNIGALHSILGAVDTRQNADGMKVSCTHFQCSAWAFEHLRDNFGCAAMSSDMSHELLTFRIQLLLAQAQECILEKSMIDSRKNTITAKVAAQVVDYYNAALKYLDSSGTDSFFNSSYYRDWRKRIELKVNFYKCIMHYYMGQQSEEQQKWGERLAFLTAAQDCLTAANKLAKNEMTTVKDALRFVQDVVGGKYTSAKKDNDFIYHEKIPALESLPEVKAASLVKGIPFNPNDPEIAGPDIFQKLVPMSAHEQASVYSEEKAKLLRKVSEDIAEKNAELDQFQASLQLDSARLEPQLERLPQELLEKCAAMSVRTDTIKELVDSMTGVSRMATEVELGIKDVLQLLKEEKEKDEEFKATFGKSYWNVILTEIQKECETCAEKHHQAGGSNESLHRAMNTHITNLRLLAGPPEDLQKALPSSEGPKSPEEKTISAEMQRLLAKVKEMREQREMLEGQLRRQLQEDDITTALITQDNTNKESLFQERLKKHDAVITLIHQNLGAQENILRALTECNAKYAPLRKANLDCTAKREAMIGELLTSYEVYQDLLAKSQKGQEYYRKLEDNTRRLLERCQAVCKQHAEERQLFLARVAPKNTQPAPSRPTAPKPSGTGAISTPSPQPSTTPHPPMPTFDGPKLKDYLPFMKPATFGPKSATPPPQAASPSVIDPRLMQQGGSLPASLGGSPVHHLPPEGFGGGSFPGGPPFDQRRPSPSPSPAPPTPPVAASPPPGAMMGLDGRGTRGGGLQGPRDPRGYSSSPSPDLVAQMPPPQGYDPRLGAWDRPPHRGAVLPDVQPSSLPTIPQNAAVPGSIPPLHDGSSFSSLPHVPSGAPQHSPMGEVRSESRFSHLPQLPEQQGPSMPPTGMQGQGSRPSLTQVLPDLGAGNLGPGSAHSQTPGFPPQHPGNLGYDARASQPSYPASASQPPAGMPPANLGQRGDSTVSVSSVETPIISPSDENRQTGSVHQHQHMSHNSPRGPPTVPGQPASQPGQAPEVGPQPGSAGDLPPGPMYTQPNMQPHQAPLGSGMGGTPQQHGAYQTGYPDAHTQGPPSGYFPGHPPHPQPTQGGGQGYAYQQNQPTVSLPPGQPYGTGQPQPSSSHDYRNAYPAHSAGGFYGSGPTPGGMKIPDPGSGLSSSHQSFPASAAQQAPSTSSTASSHGNPSGHLQTLPASYATSQPYSHPGLPPPGSQPQQPQPQPQQPQQQQQPYPQQMGYGQQQPPPNPQQGYSQLPSQQTPQQPQPQPQPPQQPQPQQQQQQPYRGQPQHQAGALPQATFPPSQPGALQGFQPQPSSAQVPQQQPGSYQQPPPQGPPHSYGMQQPPAPYQAPQLQQTQSALPGSQPLGVQPSWQPTPSQGLKGPQSLQGFQSSVPASSQQTYPGTYQAQQTAAGQQGYGQGGAGPFGGSLGVPGSTGAPGPQALPARPGAAQDAPQTSGPPGKSLQGSQLGPGQLTRNLMPQDSSQTPPASSQQDLKKPQEPQQQVPPSQSGFPQAQSGKPGEGMFGLPEGMMHPAFQLPRGRQQPLQQWQQGYPGFQSSFDSLLQDPAGQAGPGGLQQDPAHRQGSQTAPSSGAVSQQGQGFPAAGSQPVTGAPTQKQQQQQQPYGNQGYQQGSSGFPQGLGQGQPGVSAAGSGSFQNVPRSQNISGNSVGGPTMMAPPVGQVPSGLGGPQLGSQYSHPVSLGNALTGAVTPSGQGQSQPYMAAPGGIPQQRPLGLQTGPYGAPAGSMNPSPQQMGPRGDLRAQAPGQGTGGGQYPQGMYGQYPQASPLTPQGAGSAVVASSFGTQMGQLPQPLQPTANLAPSQSIPGPPPSGCPTPQGPGAGKQSVEGSSPQVLSRQSSSLDEILSSSPTSTRDTAIPAPQIVPKVLTAQEKQQQREEALKMKGFAPEPEDAYSTTAALNRFVTDVETFGTYVEGLLLSQYGGNHLDTLWKALMDSQEGDGKRSSIAIARCYPMKNRDPDIMPYDETRVTLTSMKDDYINASWINDLAPSCPKFISTQHPLGVTINDFWAMVYEQGAEVIVMITSEYEAGKKYPVYWPTEKGRPVEHGHFLLELQSVKHRELWNERIIYMKNIETRQGRNIVQLQFKSWPVSGFPENVGQVVRFITEVHTFYKQQRSLMKPVIVQCGNGVGRSGAFLLIYAGMQEVNHGNGLIDIPTLARRMLSKRKNMLQKREQLKYCYDALLFYAEDYLKKRGVLVKQPHFQDQLSRSAPTDQHPAHSADDIVLGSMDFQHLRQKVGSLGDRRPSDPTTLPHPTSEPVKGLTVPSISDLTVATSSLPDLLQQSPNKHDLEGLNGQGRGPPKEVTATGQGETILPGIGSHQARSRSGSSSSVHSVGSGSLGQGSGSGKPSPLHQPGTVSAMPQSLADLTNPSTFTLGSSEGGSKKITRTNFSSKTGSLTDSAPDPSDPLSSLDPLWSLKDKS